MKRPRSFSALLVTALLVTIAPVSFHAADDAAHGHAHDHDGAPEWTGLFGGASLALVWQSATASADHIAAALADKRFGDIPAWAETIHFASHALLDQVNLPDPEREKRLDAALDQAARLADEVLDATQHGKREQTAAAFRRLQSALNLARSRLPKEITEAARETPRFATPHDHGDTPDRSGN